MPRLAPSFVNLGEIGWKWRRTVSRTPLAPRPLEPRSQSREAHPAQLPPAAGRRGFQRARNRRLRPLGATNRNIPFYSTYSRTMTKTTNTARITQTAEVTPELCPMHRTAYRRTPRQGSSANPRTCAALFTRYFNGQHLGWVAPAAAVDEAPMKSVRLTAQGPRL